MPCANPLKCNAIAPYPRWPGVPRRPTWQRCAVTAGLLLTAAAGCQPLSAAQDPTPGSSSDAAAAGANGNEPAVAEPALPALSAAEAREVQDLLDRGEAALADDHLTYPAKGSAWTWFDRVLILDPGNDEARRGLERIVERYLDLAQQAAQARRFSHARAMLDRARLVDPSHPGIAPTAAQIRMLSHAERQVFPLDAQRLGDRDPALADTLHRAGTASRRDGCRAIITAPGDSQARWIYQQMNGAPGSERITAQIHHGSPPRIEVLCFSASS